MMFKMLNAVDINKRGMAAIDVAVMRFLLEISVPFLVFATCVYIAIPKIKKYREHLVSSFLLRLEKSYDEASASSLRRLLFPLRSIQSSNWFLRNVGLIRILVINPKTGEIFKYLPSNSHVVVHDRNAHGDQFLQSKLCAKYRDHVYFENVFIGHPEDMSSVESGSIDAVVTTRVLCSSHDVSKVLSEIHRVLAPGGKYFFMEHTQDSHPHSSVGTVQTILTKTRLWPYFTNNCHLNRTPEEDIASVPDFEQLHLDYLRLSVSESTVGKRIAWLFRLKPLYVLGDCTKRGSTEGNSSIEGQPSEGQPTELDMLKS